MARAETVARDIVAAAPASVRLTKAGDQPHLRDHGHAAGAPAGARIRHLIEASGGPERAEFNRIPPRAGLKAALAWRDARFRAPTG
jgi:enoyl-CoA hydratase